MRAHVFAAIAAACVVGSVGLSACSPSGEQQTAEPTQLLTIGELLGVPQRDQAAQEAQYRALQDATAECMIALGWEYFAVGLSLPDYIEPTDEEEAERVGREGFGVVYNLLYPQEGFTVSVSDGGIISSLMSDDAPVDPNVEYVLSLTSSEARAYNDDLYGTEVERNTNMTMETDGATGDVYPVQNGNFGCLGEAQAQIYGDSPVDDPAFQNALGDYYGQITERFEADPRILGLEQDWSECMADNGYDFSQTADLWPYVRTEFQDKGNAIVGTQDAADPLEGWTEDQINEFFATATQDEKDAVLNPPAAELTAEQRTQLEDLLDVEIEVARANLECSSVYQTRSMEIYAEIEDAFAREHADELAELLASFGQDS